MVKVIYRSDGADHPVDVKEGYSLMEGALFANVPGIEGMCGGSISCGTCHVHVAEDWVERVGPAGRSESDLLDTLDRRAPNSRLGCQVRASAALDGLVLEVATS